MAKMEADCGGKKVKLLTQAQAEKLIEKAKQGKKKNKK